MSHLDICIATEINSLKHTRIVAGTSGVAGGNHSHTKALIRTRATEIGPPGCHMCPSHWVTNDVSF